MITLNASDFTGDGRYVHLCNGCPTNLVAGDTNGMSGRFSFTDCDWDDNNAFPVATMGTQGNKLVGEISLIFRMVVTSCSISNASNLVEAVLMQRQKFSCVDNGKPGQRPLFPWLPMAPRK